MKGQRGARLASEFQKEITDIISRGLRGKCPELSAIISVTGADIAPDLKTAKIYLSIFDTDEEKRMRSFDIVKENAGYVRHELSSRMSIRTVPVLTFILDVSAEYGSHIDEILKNI